MLTFGKCYCTPQYLCSACERAIAAAEDAQDNPPDDYRDDYIDNQFERGMYPKLWES